MKTTVKLSLGIAALTLITTATVLADDPQLQNRLDLQRNQVQSSRQATTVQHSQKNATIAFYGQGKSIGRTENANRGEERWMDVSTPQGGTVNYVAPAR